MEGFSRGAMHSGTFQKDCSGCSEQKGLQGQKEKPGRGAQRGGCCRREARNNGGLDWEAEGGQRGLLGRVILLGLPGWFSG